VDKDSGQREPDGYGDLPGVHLTPNQVVAWNMAYFRAAEGLTQAQLGERLGWSAAVISSAERSWDAGRVRQFTADDLVAIAAVLRIPVPALFLPPEDDGVRVRYLTSVPGYETNERDCWDMATLMNFVMSEPSDGDGPAERRYRKRYVTALSSYLGAEYAAAVTAQAGDLASDELITHHLDRLRDQYDALRGILADNDHLQQALMERQRQARAARAGRAAPAGEGRQ
jgi:transcriptional regulator with XRE-family HTH domain